MSCHTMLTLAHAVKPHTRSVSDVSGMGIYDDQIRARLAAVTDDQLIKAANDVALDYLTYDAPENVKDADLYRAYVYQALDDLIFLPAFADLPQDVTDVLVDPAGPMRLFAGGQTDGSYTDSAKQVLMFDVLDLFDEPFTSQNDGGNA